MLNLWFVSTLGVSILWSLPYLPWECKPSILEFQIAHRTLFHSGFHVRIRGHLFDRCILWRNSLDYANLLVVHFLQSCFCSISSHCQGKQCFGSVWHIACYLVEKNIQNEICSHDLLVLAMRVNKLSNTFVVLFYGSSHLWLVYKFSWYTSSLTGLSVYRENPSHSWDK